MTRSLAMVLCAAVLAGPVVAAEPEGRGAMGPNPAACTTPSAIPTDLAGWSAAHRAIKAAAKSSAVGKALLVQGVAADVALVPTPKVAYVAEPGKPGGSVSYGGLLAFDVAEAGRYRVAQSGRSWVDVIVDGKPSPSVAHGHGPDCSGIAKMVDYDLPAGRHLLQVAANGEAALTVMVSAVR
ncbi:hypothetical protein [Novosphingobium resinovorum]|uniref:hypothetical protein n=1 Tax=Novosphingobium resinovorum TaxID=158500 RepID=UPI002ED2D772|nr:hypothetical protein [Novosphingobium resinovorum]